MTTSDQAEAQAEVAETEIEASDRPTQHTLATPVTEACPTEGTTCEQGSTGQPLTHAKVLFTTIEHC